MAKLQPLSDDIKDKIEEILSPSDPVPPRPHWTREYLATRFDTVSGVLHWKQGSVAGFLEKRTGYWLVVLDGKLVPRSKLIWMLATGDWPEDTRHKNGDKADDRLKNLELVDHSTRGAVRFKDGWAARVSAGGKKVSFGQYNSRGNAHLAYLLGLALLRLQSEDMEQVPSEM